MASPAPRAPYAVAVDVHQRNLYILIATRSGEELRRQRLPHTAAGLAQLQAWLQPGDRVVLEATTGTHALAARLEQTGATIFIADPQRARLVGMRGKKTDYRDCRALLQHLRAGELATVWRPDPTTRLLRQLTRERLSYNQTITRLKNRIKALLRDEGCPVPAALWGATGAAWLAAQPLTPAVRRLVEREWNLLQVLLTYKAAQEDELAQHALTSVPAQRLLQLTGFGPAGAMMFLGEVGDLTRFPRSKQIVSYAGLDPRVSQSDGRQHGGGICKAGRAPLRWLLIEIAWRHVQHAGPEAAHYHALVRRGKAPQVAIVAVARRLLVRAYLLLTRGENDRALEPERYTLKLRRLARRRPAAEGSALKPRAWAEARYTAVTGQPPPARPERARPTAPESPAATAPAAARGADAGPAGGGSTGAPRPQVASGPHRPDPPKAPVPAPVTENSP